VSQDQTLDHLLFTKKDKKKDRNKTRKEMRQASMPVAAVTKIVTGAKPVRVRIQRADVDSAASGSGGAACFEP